MVFGSRGRLVFAMTLATLGIAVLSSACAPGAPAVSTGGSNSGGSATKGASSTGSFTSSTTGTMATTSASTGTTMPMHCDPTSSDTEGCACTTNAATRPCYPSTANPKTRTVGTCKDGQQTCTMSGEFLKWGACTGAVTPVAENCTDGQDHNCDGKVGCAEPSCASSPACSGACTNGATRPCYDGPAGTENTGTCKPGTQVCANGQWPTICPGEVLPKKETCSNFSDTNCNGIPGCFDFLACFGDPACMPPPCMPANGCTCPSGSGDAAVCPNGDYGDPQTGLCCPCSAGTCNQVGCCGEAECAGSSVCGMLTCGPLAASCNGMVNVDCDYEDLSTSNPSNPPEDCDQACCKCKPTDCP